MELSTKVKAQADFFTACGIGEAIEHGHIILTSVPRILATECKNMDVDDALATRKNLQQCVVVDSLSVYLADDGFASKLADVCDASRKSDSPIMTGIEETLRSWGDNEMEDLYSWCETTGFLKILMAILFTSFQRYQRRYDIHVFVFSFFVLGH